MNDKQLKALKPRPKLYRVGCGEGLALEVMPTGSKLWRYRFRFDGKERMLSLGGYPKVTLGEARVLRDKEREKLDAGKDPSDERATQKFLANGYRTFEKIANRYFDEHAEETRRAAEDSRDRLTRWVYPALEGKAINSVTFKDLLKTLQRIEFAGKHETARRARSDISRVFRFAKIKGFVENDPTPPAQALKGHTSKPFPNVTDPKKVGAILRAVDAFDGQITTRIGLQLLPRLLCRPGELRTLKWSEVHADEIRLDESRTKQGQPHVIPLSKQSKLLLAELRTVTGDGELCFPSILDPKRPMSDATLGAALRRLGFAREELVPHSFRKIGSTMLHELGYESAWIERQLGHTDANKIRAVYSHAEFLPKRRVMMQEWSNHLDALRDQTSLA